MGRYKKHVNILFNWLRFPDGHRIGGKNVSHIIITGSELDNANPVWDDGRLLLTLNEGQKVVFARPGDRRRMPEHLPQA
jgi:hypothetical protein